MSEYTIEPTTMADGSPAFTVSLNGLDYARLRTREECEAWIRACRPKSESEQERDAQRHAFMKHHFARR